MLAGQRGQQQQQRQMVAWLQLAASLYWFWCRACLMCQGRAWWEVGGGMPALKPQLQQQQQEVSHGCFHKSCEDGTSEVQQKEGTCDSSPS
jgi:hypothetical protein